MTTGTYVGGARDGQSILDAPTADIVIRQWRDQVWEETYTYEPPSTFRFKNRKNCGTTTDNRKNCTCGHPGQVHVDTISGLCTVPPSGHCPGFQGA